MESEDQCIFRGDVWLIDNDSVMKNAEGMLEFRRSPVLLISTDLQANNPRFPEIVVVTCNMVDQTLPNQLYVTIMPTTENRLPYPVQVETYTIDTILKSMLHLRIGHLTKDEMALVSSKIMMVLDLD